MLFSPRNGYLRLIMDDIMYKNANHHGIGGSKLISMSNLFSSCKYDMKK